MHKVFEAGAVRSTAHAPSSDTEEITNAAEAAAKRIAPLWPLSNFVAVNPFNAFIGKGVRETAETLRRTAGARVTMPQKFYVESIDQGIIQAEDIKAAMDAAGISLSAAQELLGNFRKGSAPERFAEQELLKTVTDAAAELTGKDLQKLSIERITSWAASYFDLGQALWRTPWKERSPYEAWRAEAAIDRTPEILGLSGFRHAVERLPESADATIELGARSLGIPFDQLEDYMHRLLMTIGGWAAYARGIQWDAERCQQKDRSVIELLAVRISWELCLLWTVPNLQKHWSTRCLKNRTNKEKPLELDFSLALHDAYERAAQRSFLKLLQSSKQKRQSVIQTRPQVQAAFCIDVRSEVLRRHLEAQAPGIETIGFAGFFGIASSIVPFGEAHGSAHCPVLIAPKYRIEQKLEGVSEQVSQHLSRQVARSRRYTKIWKSFKLGAIASFGFVESFGLGYATKLIADTLGMGRRLQYPRKPRTSPSICHEVPLLESRRIGLLESGIPELDQVKLAESILRGMSLTKGFARLVLFVGHGSTTTNNPHASGLDCGACGGHSGRYNARIAAQILNATFVRQALVSRGIEVPRDCHFVACLHDTTTDRLEILDRDSIPESHSQDLINLEDWCTHASSAVRAERAGRLDLPPGVAIDKAISFRSRDWSQVRPEWGLAGCHSFIAAPRQRTLTVALEGRTFLHSYDWREDRDFSVLELIMTAPMVVASWINLQYFASTVDNSKFGAGNKVLHNVAGILGVFEGNGGDLRVGLPLQSVHDGKDWIHKPVRLSVVIEAPLHAINSVLRKSEVVRNLADNGWIHLYAMNEVGSVDRRYAGELCWAELQDQASDMFIKNKTKKETVNESVCLSA